MSYIQKLKDLANAHKGRYNFQFRRPIDRSGNPAKGYKDETASIVLKEDKVYVLYAGEDIETGMHRGGRLIDRERDAEHWLATISGRSGFYAFGADPRFSEITTKETRWDDEKGVIEVEVSTEPILPSLNI